MKPDLIKYVTADGCVAYEKVWSGATYVNPHLYRLVQNAKFKLSVVPGIIPTEARKRDYDFHHSYMDEETGKFVYEYREVVLENVQ